MTTPKRKPKCRLTGKVVMKKPIKTTNEAWGFFGTCKRNYNIHEQDMHKVFEYAARKIATVMRVPLKDAVLFLDSTGGRHFADELSFFDARENEHTSYTKQAIDRCLAKNKWIKSYIKGLKEMV